MIVWQKRGLIFKTKDQNISWMKNSALTPTPFLLGDDVIRVFAGFRDGHGVSRIGYVDVSAEDPSQVINVSHTPVLDVGRDGCFDDNGVILGDVVSGPNGIYMFYVGFQLVSKAKFLAFSGVAFSCDGGQTFSRMSEAPILGRSVGQTTIGAIHSVRYDNGRWRIWFASGNGWEYINEKPFPEYHIRYTETENLLEVPRSSNLCIDVCGSEYRIGRPRVYRINDRYLMYYTKGTTTGDYFPGVAYSFDGQNWDRHDEELGLELSETGWDSETLCYPALINYKDRTYMFYNGNNMGVDGFGFAVTSGIKLD